MQNWSKLIQKMFLVCYWGFNSVKQRVIIWIICLVPQSLLWSTGVGFGSEGLLGRTQRNVPTQRHVNAAQLSPPFALKSLNLYSDTLRLCLNPPEGTWSLIGADYLRKLQNNYQDKIILCLEHSVVFKWSKQIDDNLWKDFQKSGPFYRNSNLLHKVKHHVRSREQFSSSYPVYTKRL